MYKKNIFIIVVMMAFSAFSQAEQVLSKELIMSFQKVSQQWQALESNYPELSASFDDIDLSQSEKLISKLKSSKAYPQIKSMLAGSDFATIEEYYDVSIRLMGGIMAYQMKNMPEEMNSDAMLQMLKQSIDQMKASNTTSSMVNEMEKQLADMEKRMNSMKAAMKSTSAADMKFISDNASWIMSMLGGS